MEYRYDARDRAVQSIRVVDATTRLTTRIGYDGKGRAVSRTDPAGHAALTQYDGLGRAVQTTDALGGVTGYQYDARDNLIALTDASGQTHRFDYDAAGRKIKETRPLGGAIQYAYDVLGRVTDRTDPAGHARHFTYDAAGRKTGETHLAAGQTAPGQTLGYQYDAADRLTGYTQTGDTASSAAYTLDALGRPVAETLTYGGGTGAFTQTLRHAYTADGRRQRLDYPDGTSANYGYDQGRLQSAGLPGGGEIRWRAYQWRQPARVDYPGVVRRLDYDALQRLARIQAQAIGPGNADAPAGPVLLDWRYRFDAAGNISQRETSDGVFAYAYDPLDRLTEATPPSALQQSAGSPDGLPLERYGYDAVHNRTSSAHQPGVWAYNADNQLIQYGQGDALATLSYTVAGHLETERRSGGQTRYGYDAAERLRRLEIDGQERATYQYDPFGRRIAKTVDGQTTWYLYAPEGLLAEIDSAGRLARAYGWQPDAPFGTAPIWQAEVVGASWRFHFIQPDHLGTPQLATDAQGQITWQARPEAFGRTTTAASASFTVNLRFPGQYYDAESGLHYNYMRDYDPQTGRYIQSDPIGLRGGVNAYAYVRGNPVIRYDFLGLYVNPGAPDPYPHCGRGPGSENCRAGLVPPPPKPNCNCDREKGPFAVWAGGSAGGSFGLVAYGLAKTMFLTNVFTRETCILSVKCGGLGPYLGVVLGGSAELSISGAWCGKDLAGLSFGVLGDIGVECAGAGGSIGGGSSGFEMTVGLKGCGAVAGIALYGCFAEVISCFIVKPINF
ncbi:MAG TPA: hypothetical protein DIC59_08495, partial [Candidatus Competibacteraceae bacterium]|nr:hypothetical protein [Candidatus Competibacteraceae bacterium]